MNNLRARVVSAADQGFSLVEAVVAIGVLAVGMLSLAAVLTKAVALGGAASDDLIAKDKAYEAMENIIAARDAKLIHWDDLRNVADGGRFLDGIQPLHEPGVDGLIGTADDAAADIESMVEPGPDGQLGTDDDFTRRLATLRREIRIRPQNGSTTLREIRVIVRYVHAGLERQYELVSLVSSYN